MLLNLKGQFFLVFDGKNDNFPIVMEIQGDVATFAKRYVPFPETGGATFGRSAKVRMRLEQEQGLPDGPDSGARGVSVFLQQKMVTAHQVLSGLRGIDYLWHAQGWDAVCPASIWSNQHSISSWVICRPSFW